MENNELTPLEEDELEKNLVWLFGSSRSGTSWLSLELLSYRTNSINELHITEHLGSPNIGTLDLTFSRWYDECKNLGGYFFSEKYKKTWKHYLRKLILNRIYSQVGDFNKKIILKEPSAVSGSDIISECLPNSRIIFLLRDGRDVIDSILDGRQKNGFMTKARNTPPITEQNRFNFIENRAKFWVYLNENLLKTYECHQEKLRILIKYEELLKNTKKILAMIYEFLEIKITNDELTDLITKFSFENIPQEKKGPGKFHRSASPGEWKKHFNEKEKKVMEEIMKSTLNKLGYT